jgi:hypothetical protein
MTISKYLACLIFFYCHFINANEYYIRTESGDLIIIKTPDNTSLETAFVTGSFEIISTNNSDNNSSGEEITDSHLISHALSIYQSSTESDSMPSHSNTIELINICPQENPGETTYSHRCSIPMCKMRFKSKGGSKSKRRKHHKTHFKPDFLDSLKGQLVICPYCSATMAGTLGTILIHYARFCSKREN